MKNNKESHLTKDERHEIFQFLRHLYEENSLSEGRGYVRTIVQYLNDYHKRSSVFLRDGFGLSNICVSLKTILLASKEMGIHGTSLLVYLLKNYIDNDADVEFLERKLGVNINSRLISFHNLELMLQTKEDILKNESFLALLISQCEDMRMLLLLIAECNVKMSLIRDSNEELLKQRLSIEAAYVFAPLAHKLGLYQIKSSLEDLSLKYLEKEAYYHIKEKLNATKQDRDAYIVAFIKPLQTELQKLGLRFHIKGRTKSIHSIWQKMQKQKCSFEGVYDLFAIRIIIDAPLNKEKDYCWKAFSVLTSKYESNLNRLRDWLTVPKSNGYESLHITVLGPENKWVEVQIRTERMDEVAERGLAAHWRYKGIKAAEEGIDGWLVNIREALEQGNQEKLSHFLSGDGIEQKHVYVFSPKGDLYKLPEGGTVLDFAYAVHTKVGDHCVGARVNEKNVSIRQKLKSGDKVEVITSNAQTPKLEWLQIAISNRTKNKIRAGLKEQSSSQSSIIKEDIERKLRNRKIEWRDSIWYQIIKKYGYKEINEFYAHLGKGKIDVNDVIETYIQAFEKDKNPVEHLPLKKATEFDLEAGKTRTDDDILVIDKNIKGIDFELAKCCRPVYGDNVFGFVTVSGGIKVHRSNCPNAKALRQRFPYRIVKATWSYHDRPNGVGQYPITLYVIGNDDLGIVNNITSIISKEEHIMLRSINIDSNDGLFSGILTLMVSSKTELNKLIKKIQSVKGVKSVSR